jgi:hypothetical protein
MEAPNPPPTTEWRTSELPYWQGPEDFQFDGSHPAPYHGHRWLPVKQPIDIINTPAGEMDHGGGGLLMNWAAAAQTHYSFLTHLEKGELHKYQFDHWDYLYSRISINFLAIAGNDIINAFPFPHDDEQFITTERSKELGRHVIVDGSGTAVHFAFGPQRDAHGRNGLYETDLLPRYREYALEFICPFPNRTAGYPWKP